MSIAARRLQRVNHQPPTPSGSIQLAMSGIWGAGFQNAGDKADATVHTNFPGAIATGGDVAGVHVSDDYGNNWIMANRNLLPANNTRVVSIRWSTTTPGQIYMYASPTTGYSGVIFRGTFDKATDSINWQQIANLGKGAYAGNATPPGEGIGFDVDGDVPNHPRQTGRKLMLLDEENGFLYAGTIDGIYRLDLNTRISTAWQLSGKWITSICFEPGSHNTMFVTADGSNSASSGINGAANSGGVWRISNVRTTANVEVAPVGSVGTFSQACSAARTSDGRLNLYVATGGAKIVRWRDTASFSTASAWTDSTNNLNADSATLTSVRWAGVDTVAEGANITILATDSCNAGGRTGKTVAWSTNSGASWTKTFTLNKNINGDNAGGIWWFARPEYNNASLLIGASIFDSVNPMIDPNDSSRWYIMGRSGIWRTNNRGAEWHPIVKGTGVTTTHYISCLPHEPDKAMAADTDWSSIFSLDGFTSQPSLCKKLGRVGWVIEPKHFPNGTTPDRSIVISVGSRDGDPGTRGNVTINRDAWSNGLNTGWWHQVNSDRTIPGVANPDSTPRCTGSTLAQVGANEVILAAFQGKGLFRKVGVWQSSSNPGGAWRAVAGKSSVGSSKGVPVTFAWSKSNPQIVWMCDPRNSTVARSTDAGLTWTTYSSVSLSYTSAMLADPSHPGTYYFLGRGSVWRITNGDSTPVLTQLPCPESREPSCIAVHPTTGRLAVSVGKRGGDPKFWTIEYNQTTYIAKTVPNWLDVGVEPLNMTWGSNDKLYVSLFAGYVVIQGLANA